MEKTNKNIFLGIAVVVIVGAIWFIESSKIPPPNATEISATSTPNQSRAGIIKQKSLRYPSAIELIPGGQFINAQPFKLQDLVGKKVILVDFWTYTCINCLRTLPYLEAWDAKYKGHGLVIVGVHTPEFDFEKDFKNVSDAVARLGIKYPVVQDNNRATWDAFQNQYWPHEYLIDIDGFVVHDKIGEGAYDQSEREIQSALKEREQVLGLADTIPSGIVSPTDAVTVNPTEPMSPETYFGAARNEFLMNGKRGTVGTQQLSLPSKTDENKLYLDGAWDFQNEFAKNTNANAKIFYRYNAKNVYFVGRAETPVIITILLDGKPIGNNRGEDVSADDTVTIKENRLYKLIKTSDYGDHTLEIIIKNPGLEAYTFTFG